jgi:hypothetical protein
MRLRPAKSHASHSRLAVIFGGAVPALFQSRDRERFFALLRSRDRRESRWACGPPIEMKNDREMANCWRNSGRSSGERFFALLPSCDRCY